MAEGLLAGIRLLDLTNVLAGPYCAYQFALLGADVLKIEAPEGDLARGLGADPDLNRLGMGASFLAQNAGKRSVVLDLKVPADRARFLALVDEADALVENFRPGVMERLGLGPAPPARQQRVHIVRRGYFAPAPGERERGIAIAGGGTGVAGTGSTVVVWRAGGRLAAALGLCVRAAHS